MFVVVGTLIENETNINDGGVWVSRFIEKCKRICVLQCHKKCHRNKCHSRERIKNFKIRYFILPSAFHSWGEKY